MWYCLLIASCYISKIFAGYFFNQQLFHILECYDTGLLTCDKIEFAVHAAYITTRISWTNCHFSAFGENYFRNEWNTQEKVLYTPCVNSRCFLLARLRLYSVIFLNSSFLMCLVVMPSRKNSPAASLIDRLQFESGWVGVNEACNFRLNISNLRANIIISIKMR